MNYRQPFTGDYPISQGYGEQDTSDFHTGIDYACPIGTPILASADGTVRFAGQDTTGYGVCVIIQHASDRATLYAHLSAYAVRVTQSVKQGDVIGYSGNTGNSTGPHLHFEARTQWNSFRTHFNPLDLPLMSIDDRSRETDSGVSATPSSTTPDPLKNAEAFDAGDLLTIMAPLGAKSFYVNGFKYASPYPRGSVFRYTGETAERNGYTYLKVQPLGSPVWIAVHDGETQILDK